MAGGGGGARGELSSEPNVVPMIDILLVLLIIFMITQPLSRMAMDVQVPPPDTTTATQQANNQIVLELADDGGYAINGQPVPKDQLDTQIHAIFDPRPAKLLFIKAGAEPDLSGRDRGDGRGAGGGGSDHRIHPPGSEQEVAPRGPAHRVAGTRGGRPAPACFSGRARRLSGVGSALSFRPDATYPEDRRTRSSHPTSLLPGRPPPLRRPGRLAGVACRAARRSC